MPTRESLPPYDPDAHCPKCGRTTPSVEYHSSWSIGMTTNLVADWLIRRCRRCGHAWNEACLDAHAQASVMPVGNFATPAPSMSSLLTPEEARGTPIGSSTPWPGLSLYPEPLPPGTPDPRD